MISYDEHRPSGRFFYFFFFSVPFSQVKEWTGFDLLSSSVSQYGLLSGGGDELHPLPAPGGLWLDPPSHHWGSVGVPPCHLRLVSPLLQPPLASPGKHVCSFL